MYVELLPITRDSLVISLQHIGRVRKNSMAMVHLLYYKVVYILALENSNYVHENDVDIFEH